MLKELQENLENDFEDCMNTIEDEIQFVLDRMSVRKKDNLGWHELTDITQH